MNRAAQAIIYEAIGAVAVRPIELSDCGETEIVVQTHYTLVSTGTELRVLQGHYGAQNAYPLIPGYSVVGEVIATGPKVDGFRVGDKVTCRNPKAVPHFRSQWGGQASKHIYPTTGEDRPVLLPVGADPLDYVIAEISAISWRGVEAARPAAGETAVVLGQGLIGGFSAAWLHARGCRVIIADIEPGRLERALAWGAAAAVHIGNPDAEARINTLTNGGADIVVESSGTTNGAMMAYRLARQKPQRYGEKYKVEPIHFYGGDWPRIVMQANYLEPVTIDPFSIIAGEGMTLLAPKDRGIEDRQQVVEQIRRGAIQPRHFIQRIVSFAQAPEAYLELRDDKARNFSLVIDWRTA